MWLDRHNAEALTERKFLRSIGRLNAPIRGIRGLANVVAAQYGRQMHPLA